MNRRWRNDKRKKNAMLNKYIAVLKLLPKSKFVTKKSVRIINWVHYGLGYWRVELQSFLITSCLHGELYVDLVVFGRQKKKGKNSPTFDTSKERTFDLLFLFIYHLFFNWNFWFLSHFFLFEYIYLKIISIFLHL